MWVCIQWFWQFSHYLKYSLKSAGVSVLWLCLDLFDYLSNTYHFNWNFILGVRWKLQEVRSARSILFWSCIHTGTQYLCWSLFSSVRKNVCCNSSHIHFYFVQYGWMCGIVILCRVLPEVCRFQVETIHKICQNKLVCSYYSPMRSQTSCIVNFIPFIYKNDMHFYSYL